LTLEILAGAGMAGCNCATVGDLCEKLEEGASAAVLTEEAFAPQALRRLVEVLAKQPAWSDFPLILFGDSKLDVHPALDAAVAALGNVTVLERPVRVRALLAAARTALRARARQYQARRAIHSRDQFLAMLGHELRNPLAAIRIAVELLERGQDPTAQANQRAIIDRQSRHLGRLVDDLLDVARVTYGKVALQIARLDLSELLRRVVQAYDHLARASNVTVAIDVVDGLLVAGDRVRLDQTFGNLVANAIKYTPAGGSVLLEARAERKMVVVTVTDSGMGIDPATLPHVFELFAQADRSLDRAQGGMGLGLTLVKSLVRLHGGTVQASSAGPGRGSQFTVRLPLVDGAAEREDAPPRPSASGLAGKRVVLVDDSTDLRTLFEELLIGLGVEVGTASDGPEGVDRIVAARPDIAFVDIGLPGFDGYEVARRVRKALGDTVLLVAMTGYGQNDDRHRALEAGFDRHLTKPVGVRDIEKAIAGSARQQRAAGAAKPSQRTKKSPGS
jgi:signal transduction histidine kinase/CheY-like chemotaxis protein